MREIPVQTPQRDQTLATRRAKSNLDTSKKSNKVLKKNLIKDFSDASGDLLPLPISDHILLTESSQTITDSLHPANSPLALSVSAPDLTPSSTLTTAGAEAFIDSSDPVNMPLPFSVSESDLSPSSSITICGTKEEGTGQTITSGPLKITSVESDFAVKHLRESMVQLLNSRDVDSRNKKILAAVVNAVIEDLPGIGISDGDWFNKLATKKAAVVLLNFLGVITAIQFFISGRQLAPYGPTPT